MDIETIKRQITDSLTKFNKNRYGEEVRSFLTEAITLLKDLFPLSTDSIEDKAISSDKLQAGSVTQPKIQDGAVTEGKIRDGAVTGAKISEKAVDLSKIKPADTANKVLVTVFENGKMETHWREIDSSMIMDEQIQNSDIKNDSIVGSEKLKPKSVTGGRIADKTIGTDQLSDKSVNADKLQAGSVTQPKIQDGAVTEGKIRDGAVSESKLSADLLAKLSSLGGTGDVSFNFKGNLKKITLQDDGGVFMSEFNDIWALDGRQSGTVVISSKTKEKRTIIYSGLAAGAVYRFTEDGDVPRSVRYEDGKEAEFQWINVKSGDVWKYCGLSMEGDIDFVEDIGLSPSDTNTNFEWEYLGNVATADDLKTAIDDNVIYSKGARTYLLRKSGQDWEEIGYGIQPKKFSRSNVVKGSVLRFLEDGTFEYLSEDGLYYNTVSVSRGDEWRFNGLVNFGAEFSNPIGEDWDYLGNVAPNLRVRHYVGGTIEVSASCECVSKQLFILTFDADDPAFDDSYSMPMYCFNSIEGDYNIDWPSDDIVIVGVKAQGMLMPGGGSVGSRYRVVVATSTSEAGDSLKNLIVAGGANFGLWFETLCYYYDESASEIYTLTGRKRVRHVDKE